ncbi:MAG: DUF1963 domain-containing protein [Saprospiraceae bacterium]
MEKDNTPQERDVHKDFEEAIELLSKFKRKAYLPKIKDSLNSYSTVSKIGGFPHLRNENDWPICPNCKMHMQLFLQLNLEELPEIKEDGLIQLFYCTTTEPLCESELEAFFPFSKSVVCRRIEAKGDSVRVKPEIKEIFQEKTIIDWEDIDDYPHFEEYLQLGIELELEDDVYELMERDQIGLPIEKDKLFGWPYWIQASEYPFDRKTGTQMELLFQFASEDNLPWMFGDAGIGHLTQSPDDEAELGFGWACG